MHSFSAVFCVSIFFLIHNLEIYGFSGRSSSHFSACFSFRFSFFQKSFPFENFLVKMENQFLWQDPVPSSSPASTKFYTLIPHNICIFPHKQLAGTETRISRPPTKKRPCDSQGVFSCVCHAKYLVICGRLELPTSWLSPKCSPS